VTQRIDAKVDAEMPRGAVAERIVMPASALDPETAALVRLAGVIAAGSEPEVRRAMARAAAVCRPAWVEEVVLQSYLFAGFPRALNAAREWRRASGQPAPDHDEGEDFENAPRWREQGEATCATVYGPFYERLRHNIRHLHPALDAWMIIDGYGKVLSRPALDLRRRELCIVGACSLARQDRQLHSHLYGALHAGASAGEIRAALDEVADLLGPDDAARYHQLLNRVLAR
jgi:4-carboxymuconolactone decarboxylase